MGKIIVKGLRLKAYHGVNPEEKINGQMFELDITAELNFDKSTETDELSDTVSYSKIIKTVRAVFTEGSYNLIEYVAKKVAMAVMTEYPQIDKVTVLLKKPEAPISADFDYVAVEQIVARDEVSL
ncbi:MAG: dihydroneopterin aldolase [Oscillospiraceae bacterium]|nr:dihydroneopterin aldolase [Oscillospiraceae bacterium]